MGATIKCPFCAEEIQAAAIKCRYCGEWLEKRPENLPSPGVQSQAPHRPAAPSMPQPPLPAQRDALTPAPPAVPSAKGQTRDALPAMAATSNAGQQAKQAKRRLNARRVVAVLAILGVAAGFIAVPMVRNARQDAVTASSRSNLQQLGLALTLYASDHDETFPPMQDAAAVKSTLLPYVRQQKMSEDIFLQPAAGQPYQPNAALSGRYLAEITSPAEVMTFYESVPRADGKRNVAFVDGHIELLSEEEWQPLRQASTMQPAAISASTTGQTPAALKPRLVIVRGSFRTERIYDQERNAEAYCGTAPSPLSKTDRQQVRLAIWTLRIKNPTTQVATQISFKASYYKTDGTAVQPGVGLKRWQGCGANNRFGLRPMTGIEVWLSPGEEDTLVVYDLVSKNAAQQLRKGRGKIVIWADRLEDPPPPILDPVPDNPGDGSAAEDGSNESGSDVDRYVAKLNNAPNMAMFVSSVKALSEGTVKITMTSDYHRLDYHDRLKLAQTLLQLWQLVHAPDNPNTAWIVLEAEDGTTVGGQKLTGTVWVEE